MLEVRRSLEELAIELACQRMTEEDMQALEEAQKAFKAAIDQGDAMKIAETDEAYHDVIYHSTRNKRLVQILNTCVSRCTGSVWNTSRTRINGRFCS